MGGTHQKLEGIKHIKLENNVKLQKI